MTEAEYLALRRDALLQIERWRDHIALLDAQWAKQESARINAHAFMRRLAPPETLEVCSS